MYHERPRPDHHALEGQNTSANDGVEKFLNARYISTSEAFWRLYGFEIQHKHPAVKKLPCHLPNEQTVVFAESEAEDVVRNGPPVTKLIAFFSD